MIFINHVWVTYIVYKGLWPREHTHTVQVKEREARTSERRGVRAWRRARLGALDLRSPLARRGMRTAME
jgi:hypothetical protein